MRRLICAFVVRIWLRQVLSWRGSYYKNLGGEDWKFCHQGNCLLSSRVMPNRYPEWQNIQSAPHNHHRFFILHTFLRQFYFLKLIRGFYGCEVRIVKSVRGSLFGIRRLCRVMPNGDSEEWIFLSTQNSHDRFFSCIPFDLQHLIWMLELPLTIMFLFNDVCHVESWRHMWRHNYVTSQHLNDRAMWSPIKPMYWQHLLLFVFFIYPTGRIRVCKIRFVSTGENCRKPCLVCKNE